MLKGAIISVIVVHIIMQKGGQSKLYLFMFPYNFDVCQSSINASHWHFYFIFILSQSELHGQFRLIGDRAKYSMYSILYIDDDATMC